MRLSVLNMLNLGRSNRIMSVSEALEQLRSVYFGFTDKLRKHSLKITDCHKISKISEYPLKIRGFESFHSL